MIEENKLDVPEPVPPELVYTGEPKTPSGKEISEDMGVHKQWYLDSKGITLNDLPAFLKHLTDDYHHDYGTICHAMAAGAIATMRAINDTDQGGITGFQAGAIMWEFIREWMQLDGPLALRNYKDMLYPQYDYKFEKTISKDTWEWLQEEAKKNLSQVETNDPELMVADRVKAHWKSIVDGVVPFGWSVSEDE